MLVVPGVSALSLLAAATLIFALHLANEKSPQRLVCAKHADLALEIVEILPDDGRHVQYGRPDFSAAALPARSVSLSATTMPLGHALASFVRLCAEKQTCTL